ncbi:phosphopantetheine-binding protein [Streptomyces sp. TRM76323]|uniref:Phosphopantetheine-binding protein n=1 Tax=Streptomyces tamarix TaxID=3078565 RepID=A0ABU3QP00_9ACTN|nr:phosphopantetheine-binding protein [Streptomyces tamarix]MDT9684477.1 phosphopantetheine-binding protein [Streptomyces tamarix]
MVIGSEFRNPMDALVVDSVRRLLGDTSIGIDDNFMDIGGNSIIAVRLGQVLSEELGISRTARIIFKNPVLRDLSDKLSALVDDAA